MAEGAVLHHQHDDRVDRHVLGRGERPPALVARGLRDERVGRKDCRERCRDAGGQRGALQELTAAQVLVGCFLSEPFGVRRIVQVGHPGHGSRRCTGNVAVA
jgi:hypothetical protein